jgi:WD repeat-containing protein 19
MLQILKYGRNLDHFLQVKNHKDSLTGIAISTAVGKAASCGENTIKVHELHDLKDTSNVINIDDERGLVSHHSTR